MSARCRQNYHCECETGVNKQINLELYASYVYLSMAYYFDRDDVALKGFHKYFKKASDEEIEHARLFMEFQNKRGGRIILKDIKRPEKDEWGNGKDALETALDLEKSVNESLFKLHELSQTHKDDQMSDFIESNFLHEQVDAIKELSDYITNLERVGEGLGEFQFDKLTLLGDDS